MANHQFSRTTMRRSHHIDKKTTSRTTTKPLNKKSTHSPRCGWTSCTRRISKVCRFWTSSCSTWYKSTRRRLLIRLFQSLSTYARRWNAYHATARTRPSSIAVWLSSLWRSCPRPGPWDKFMRVLEGLCSGGWLRRGRMGKRVSMGWRWTLRRTGSW
jgi:hypothetical protein